MLAISAVAAVVFGGAGLGACTPSTAGAPCSGSELAQENGRILRCENGQFVAGESLEDFVRNFLKELEIKIKLRATPPTCPSATEAGADAYMPNCPSPCPSASEAGADAYMPNCPDPCASATGVDAIRPGC